MTQGVPDTSELEARAAVGPSFLWLAFFGGWHQAQLPSYSQQSAPYQTGGLKSTPCCCSSRLLIGGVSLASFLSKLARLDPRQQEARKEAERVAAEKERLAREAGRLEQVG